jgi:GntR family transcriptional repressor for pyruvate dehydrogenase complex
VAGFGGHRAHGTPLDLRPITRQSASDEVFDRLAASIVEGEVGAGEPMPSERALAEGLGVSRPVVREALKRLAHAGLVQIRHGGATLVTDYRRGAGPDLLQVLLLDRNGDLDLEVARSIVEARSDLGPPVAAAAARRVTAGDLSAMRTIVDQMRETDDLATLQRLALDLWDRVVDASGNVVHRLLFNALRRAYEPVMDALLVVMRDEVSDVDGYAAVVAALEARDPARAEAAVRAVVDHGARATVEVIDQLLTDD